MKNDSNNYDAAINNLGEIIMSLYESREYSCGRFVLRFISYLRRGKFIKLVSYLSSFMRTRKLDKAVSDSGGGDSKIKPVVMPATSNYTITVYKCVLNGYDTVYPPIILPKNYRFVLVTNDDNYECCGWEIKKVPEYLNAYTPTEINRYVKTHPKEFCDSDYAIYLDGNILSLLPLDDYIGSINEKSGIAMFSHPQRKCLYDEAQVCLRYKKGNISAIEETIARYRNEGMPSDYGLNEGGVVASDLNNSKSIYLLKQWWDEVVNNRTNRDQISFPYIVWKNDLCMNDIGRIGKNIRDNTKIKLLKHNAI